ncbi:MAG: guanylate kinase [Candidatus Aminicenantes bacterium]|nr:guanylate kinase [Candidatus Aminicenantes bacterium]MDH5713943.1 guanylate kinase [Candidatus Aminicenantes bacterium]
MYPIHRAKKGQVFIISAPSGSGKTTLGKELLNSLPDLQLSISYTTRKPRPGEQEGVDYFFLTREEFEKKRMKGELIEWAEVFGHYYGTSRKRLTQHLQQGKDVLLLIDVQGAIQIMEKLPRVVSIFVLPPSRDALKQRLEERGTDTAEEIQRRLKVAEREIDYWSHYDYIVINETLTEAVEKLKSIIVAEHSRQEVMKDVVQRLIDDFRPRQR